MQFTDAALLDEYDKHTDVEHMARLEERERALNAIESLCRDHPASGSRMG